MKLKIEQLNEGFSPEYEQKVKELSNLMSDAFSKTYIPLVVIDKEKVKEDLEKSKKILSEIV
ncbi:MAG: hypothetical protein QXL18_05155 [Candidatus Woesearchaeota archaeon]